MCERIKRKPQSERINMNKRKIICLAAAALLCVTAASCGNKKQSSDDKAQITTAASTTAKTTAVTTETATETETTTAATETTTAEDFSEEYLSVAVRLFEALNSADMMQSGAGVGVDMSTYREFNTKINNTDTVTNYFMVSDSRFGSLEQVRQFVTDSFCGELLEKYKGICDGDSASFKEYGGNLYFLFREEESGVEYAGQPEISSASADAFTAAVPVNRLGSTEIFTIKAVKEGDKWKASSLSKSKMT